MVMSLRRFALVAVVPLVAALASGGCTDTAKKISIGVVAYVRPGDELFKMLLDPAVEPPEYVVVNLDNGDGDMTPMDATADFLHLRTTRDGTRVKVFGYVWTSALDQPGTTPQTYDFSKRPEADIRTSVDNWLVRPDGRVHYDGIFFDVASPVCPHRDKFLRLRDHVRSRYPAAVIVHNPGVAVHSCYLQPGRRTADIFATFEGGEQVYFTPAPPAGTKVDYGYWLGGNVSHNSEYVLGDTLTFPDGTTITNPPGTFWHLLYGGTPGREQATADLIRARKAGILTVSTAPGGKDLNGKYRNQWIKGPGEPAHLRALLQHVAAPAPAAAAP